jgi:hypothetical protein
MWHKKSGREGSRVVKRVEEGGGKVGKEEDRKDRHF